MSDKIKVLVVEPMKPCEVREISGLDEMRAIVGGHIQAVYPFQDEVALICNEDGKILGLPYNRPLANDRGVPYDMICGTFFLAGLGAEDFTSLNEEQIKKFSALYDNMVVLAGERTDIQAEAVPEATMSYFAIGCQISFRMTGEDQPTDTMKETFVNRVTEIFDSDEALSGYRVSELYFSFHDDCAEVEYSFADRTTEESLAEAFSEQCVRRVQAKLEEYGYKIEKIDCYAERLVDDLPQVEAPPKKQETQKKKGHHHER